MPLFLLIDGQYDIAEIVLLDNFSLWEKISKHQTIVKRNAHLVRKSLVSVAKWSPAFLNPIEPKFDVLQIRVAYLVLQKLSYKSSTHEGKQVLKYTDRKRGKVEGGVLKVFNGIKK